MSFFSITKTEQQHQGYGSMIPSNRGGGNFVGLDEVIRNYFFRLFLYLKPRSEISGGVEGEDMSETDGEIGEKNLDIVC